MIRAWMMMTKKENALKKSVQSPPRTPSSAAAQQPLQANQYTKN